MRRAPRVEKIWTVCNEIGDIGDSMKGSSSPMKNKLGAQKGALIKMKQENMYIYQWLYRLCYVPIIAPLIKQLAINISLSSEYLPVMWALCKHQQCMPVAPTRYQRLNVRWEPEPEPGLSVLYKRLKRCFVWIPFEMTPSGIRPCLWPAQCHIQRCRTLFSEYGIENLSYVLLL